MIKSICRWVALQAEQGRLIGVLWEEIVFFVMPISGYLFLFLEVRESKWQENLPLEEQAFELALFFVGFAIVTSLCTWVFTTFHRPGHFHTWWMEVLARRLYRKMKAALAWRNDELAATYALQLLPIAKDLWVAEGSEFARSLLEFARPVISHQETKAEEAKDSKEVNDG